MIIVVVDSKVIQILEDYFPYYINLHQVKQADQANLSDGYY